MRIRTLPLIFALLTLLGLVWAEAANAAGGPASTIQLQVIRSTLLADGKQATEVRAYVRDINGRPIGNNVEVQFQTTAGQLSSTRATTFGGVATVRLTSAPIAGIAKITAFTAGASSDVVDVLFTDDPAATFEGNSYMTITAASYLAYSATDRVIEGQGKNGGAKLTYRNMELTADRLQVRCDDLIVRASDNVVLKRGGHVFRASRLYYSMQSGQGYAIAELEDKLQPVVLSGDRLRVEASPTPIPSSYMVFPELQIKLVIVARAITYFPGDRLQFRRPKFYQDQGQILTLPYYELSLNSTELFSDQFISLGTSGFGLELPFYFNLSPRSTGIVYLRHQQQLGRSYYATDPGWSLDLVQGYSAQGSRRYEGAFGFTGLTRGDWGFRWTHSQEFNTATQASFYLDFPHHEGYFGSTNFSQQARAFRWGANISSGQTFTGPSAKSFRSDVYLETQPKPLTRSMLYTLGTTVTTGRLISEDFRQNETTETVSMRAFSRPYNLDRRTTLTNAFTVGHLWTSRGNSGPMALATLALDHTVPGGGALNLSYDLVFQPQTFDSSGGNHRLSLTYTLANSQRFQASLLGTTYLDRSDATFLADVVYRLNGQWRLLASATLQSFAGVSYQDLEFSIGRRIGARELQLTYSTLNKRISLDLTATRF